MITQYPNPQFRRKFISLDGPWGFEWGDGEGKHDCALSGTILVPYCPESSLSGVGGQHGFSECVYTRTLELTEGDREGRLVVHFGAVDYLAEVYVNGHFVVRHAGGYTPFEADIAPYVHAGTNRLTVVVRDDMKDNKPSGKQSKRDVSEGCFYTRTTGIWQPVWLEHTPERYLRCVKFYPDPSSSSVRAEVVAVGGGFVEIFVRYEGREVGYACGETEYRRSFELPLSEKHLWEAGEGALYDVELRLGEDIVETYFGLRSAEYEGRKFLLNGKPLFERFVLDQGYYPDGIYTAPSVEAMREDIRLAQTLGFNGARLHQKVFDPRFLYLCDAMGYLVWGEYPSWGVDYENLDALGALAAEWTEAVERDFNHPSIITWCPLNEVWENYDHPERVRDPRFAESIYALTKAIDPTRPCVDASGGYHGSTDVYDFHCYHDSERLKEYFRELEERGTLTCEHSAPPRGEGGAVYDGELPLNLSEYGGIAYVASEAGWGYRTSASEDEFVEEYVRMTSAVMRAKKLSGFCYTQLYDVEQEQNGLYTYERFSKLGQSAMARIRACNLTVAAIEEGGMSENEPRETHSFAETDENLITE